MIVYAVRLFAALLVVFTAACGNPYTDYESGRTTSEIYLDGKIVSVVRGGSVYFRPLEGYSLGDITDIEVYRNNINERNKVWAVGIKNRFDYRFMEVQYGMTSADFITLRPAQALIKGETYIVVVHIYGFAPSLHYRFVY